MSGYPYERPVEPETIQIDGDKLAQVVSRFQDQKQDGAFPGGQLVLRRAGKLVSNVSIGVARGFRAEEADASMPVHPHTLFPVLSAGKPLAAIAVALLEQLGKLDVEAPIAAVFPEFACHGKEEITTVDVLTHRSGILMPDFVHKMHLWQDREAIRDALIATVPSYSRGTLAYAPHEFGWILSEIVLLVDGRTLPDFVNEEIATPLGLPDLRFGLDGRDRQRLAYTYWLGAEKVLIAGSNVADGFEDQNSAQFLEAKNPATSMVSNAATLAAFYDFLLRGGLTPSGLRIVSGERIRRYTACHVYAWDRSLKSPMAVGRGFVLGTLLPSTFGWWNTQGCFGHAGGFSSLAFADQANNISVAIVTNGNRGLRDFLRRFLPLAQGIRNAVK